MIVKFFSVSFLSIKTLLILVLYMIVGGGGHSIPTAYLMYLLRVVLIENVHFFCCQKNHSVIESKSFNSVQVSDKMQFTSFR